MVLLSDDYVKIIDRSIAYVGRAYRGESFYFWQR